MGQQKAAVGNRAQWHALINKRLMVINISQLKAARDTLKATAYIMRKYLKIFMIYDFLHPGIVKNHNLEVYLCLKKSDHNIL